MDQRRPRATTLAIVVIALATAACGSGQTATAAPAPPAAATASAITLEAPAEVAAGSEVEVTWTASPGNGDYLAILPAGATTMADGAYTNLSAGNPAVLVAPAEPGDYEIVYIVGDTLDRILARRPIKVN